MAQQQVASGGAASVQRTCQTIEDMLTKVTSDLNAFEARKLNELKTELEALKKKKAAAVEDYQNKFDALKRQWCEQNDRIKNLHHDLKCAFPDGKWRDLIAKCICNELKKRRQMELWVECRSEVKGRYETARDQAKSELDSAKATAMGWENAVQNLKAQLDANGKAIEAICKLPCGDERAVAIYRLWFQLLPLHARLRPETECFDIPVDELPEKLCPCEDNECTHNCDKCIPEDYQVNGSDGTQPPATPDSVLNGSGGGSTQEEWPLGAPWLIHPDKYSEKLDCVYQDYSEAREAYALAAAKYKDKPDDLAQVKKGRDALIQVLDTTIETCLKSKKPKGCCDEEGEQQQDSTNSDSPKQTGA